jgi:hypothetical protein
MRTKTMNAYEKIENDLKLDKLKYVGDILVTIRINDGIISELLKFDTDDYNIWVWENDWWEGEENVEFVGAQLLCDVIIKGNRLEYRE